MLMKSTWPLATWVRASGPPLNGTWVALNPAAMRSRSTAQLLHDSLESLAQSGKAGVDMAGKTRP
jgi:hypothetical protein